MVEPLQNVLGRVILIHTVIFLMCRDQRVHACAASLAMPSNFAGIQLGMQYESARNNSNHFFIML